MSSVASIGQQALGKDQFLQLFATQMKMQNPMDPTGSEDFLAQLAQFSSLEQISNLNTNFEKMLATQQILQAADLVGKTVTYQDPGLGSLSEGRVTGVSLLGEQPVLMLGLRQVNLNWVTGIYEQ